MEYAFGQFVSWPCCVPSQPIAHLEPNSSGKKPWCFASAVTSKTLVSDQHPNYMSTMRNICFPDSSIMKCKRWVFQILSNEGVQMLPMGTFLDPAYTQISNLNKWILLQTYLTFPCFLPVSPSKLLWWILAYRELCQMKISPQDLTWFLVK